MGIRPVVFLITGCLAIAAPGPGDDAHGQPASRQAPSRVYGADDSLVKQVVGVYRSDADPKGHVMIGSIGHRTLQVTCGRACESVGFWDGTRFRGVLRLGGSSGEALGVLRFGRTSGDTLRAELLMDGDSKPTREIWVRVGNFGDDTSADRPDAPGDMPKPGESVYVEELPEAITKVPPVYPTDGRKLEGTVVVQALVGRDGLVKDTRIVKSIPLLNDAAIAAVKQWTFKPATAKGEPVAVWVAIPIKFSLH